MERREEGVIIPQRDNYTDPGQYVESKRRNRNRYAPAPQFKFQPFQGLLTSALSFYDGSCEGASYACECSFFCAFFFYRLA